MYRDVKNSFKLSLVKTAYPMNSKSGSKRYPIPLNITEKRRKRPKLTFSTSAIKRMSKRIRVFVGKNRSEERRVGKECRTRRQTYTKRNKTNLLVKL